MKHLIQFHLETDLGLPKLTARRWLRERLVHPGEAPRWQRAKALLDRWSRRYTAAEVQEILKLGTEPHLAAHNLKPGRRGPSPRVLADRQAIVTRVQARLEKYVQST